MKSNLTDNTITDIFIGVVIIILLFICVFPFAGCVGSGEGGAFTPQDAEAMERATSGFIRDYEHVRYPDRPVYPSGAPFPVYAPTP